MQLYCLLVIIGIISNTIAFQSIAPKPKDYKGSATCYMDKLGEFDSGQIKQSKDECLSYECQPAGSVKITGCGAISKDPQCKIIPEKVELDYPDCCPQSECD